MLEAEYKPVPTEDNRNTRALAVADKQIKYGFGVRHVQVLLIFICLTLEYQARAHLGVTIVGMTDSHDNRHISHTTDSDNITLNTRTIHNHQKIILNGSDKNIIEHNNYSASTQSVYRTFDWPKSTQEMVLGSFFLGYCIMMFPMGLVTQRWGGKIPLQIAMLVNGVFSFVTPWLVIWGDWQALCVVRVLQGLSQAGVYPAIVSLISVWVPVCERARLSCYINTGPGVGTILAFQLGGILAFSKFGWASTYWVTGVACIAGFILITLFGAASPMKHKSISNEEKLFIIGTQTDNLQYKAKVPWKSVLTSIPAWATFTAHVGTSVCLVFVFIQVPSYMHWILKLDVRSSGIFSSLPYIVSFFSSIVFGYTSDYLTNNKILSIKNARRLYNSIASVIPAICLALVCYTSNVILATTCFILCTTATAAIPTGWMVNYVDLAPNYSGALMATGNTITNFVVLALPVVISCIVTDVKNQLQWKIVMFLMAGLTMGTNIIFVLFMTSDVQLWNNSAAPTLSQNETLDMEEL